ncbi:ubiquitin carboxyl-terminal hydrolase 8 [Phlebotomus argentipes]|uniref:ubiquitin carboxyl-terminal hydrolase 8 n=1 Tax=Phlebotomus argentipes TaxID=94469 RepID=UPI0028929AAB|nr:ubiquitin carboxyl-terminal hydrolase 8 [Phlebotomus argentipes]
MSYKLQELKCKSFEELSSLYAVPNLKRQKVKTLVKSAVKLYEEAEKQYDLHDEEQSFVLYMKYFNVVQSIRNASDYLTHKNYVATLLGTNLKQKKALDRTEALSKSLRKRYDLLRMCEECDEEEEDLPEANPVPETSMETEKSTSVTSQQLFFMIQGGEDVLVLDCRPREDFLASRLMYDTCLNIPEEVILPGMTAGRLYNELGEQEKILWNSRSARKCVVLMDWSSRGSTPVRPTSLWYLLEILQIWDPDVTYSHLVMLSGGYEDFILRYPMCSTNPKALPPASKTADENSLEEIEYPSIGDIVMKKEFSAQPSVDRGSKAAAILTYEQKEQHVQDLLEQQEEMVEKGLKIEKERLKAEKSFQQLNETFARDEELQAREAKEQELIYTMMQMENRERDVLAENERIKRELAEYKQREAEIAAKEEAATRARIEEKEREKMRLQEQRQRLEMERDRKLKEAREQKKLLQENKENAIPIINRDSKPHALPAREVRDLAPVVGSVQRGLTGLKNLGNSCYMNSVVQCLSNTASFKECILRGLFRKQINHASKTKGRIVEELAAVVEALWCGQYRFISAVHFKCTVGAIHAMFRDFEQQDAHEFLTILMDMLHLDLQTIATSSQRDHLPMSEKAWLDFTKSRESVILRLFYGQIKSTVKCKECGKESATYDSFSNLSLELPSSHISECHLDNCFDMYFNGETIAGWNCPACKQSRSAVKKLDISKLPPILVVHLKRFCADQMTVASSYRKKRTNVKFPLENLDLSAYITRSEKRSRKMYQLYAVSNHFGTMDSGHYTAFCRNPDMGRWFNYDDDKVSAMDSRDVQSSAAYILFYTFH